MPCKPNHGRRCRIPSKAAGVFRMGKTNHPSPEKAAFAAGCFWGVQERFDSLDGVLKTAVGYTGGKTANPTYQQVCSHATGHAEAVEVEFDPEKISYAALLDFFFSIHNPTTKNRQGLDIGPNYRSAIFFHGEKQKEEAEKAKEAAEKSGKWNSPIVTEIVPASVFYPAEEYHQKYFMKTGGGSCSI